MTRNIQFVGLTFLIAAFLLNGCELLNRGPKPRSTGADRIKQTAAEQKKARLLSKIDRDFDNPQTHFELAQLYQADGLWAKAENEYATALDYDPAYWQAQAARVKVLIALGDNTKAELLADEYMRQASTSAAGSLELALAFQKQQLDEYALACYRQALRLAPTSAKINRQIGYYYLSKNNTERAKDYLMRSFNLDPLQPEVAGELGRLGVPVEVPRKTTKHTRKLDKIVERSDNKMNP